MAGGAEREIAPVRFDACWLVTAGVMLLAPAAQAAGPFDGPWQGTAQGSAATSTAAANTCVASITASVTDNVLRGTMTFPRATVPLGGTIAPDGSFKTVGGTMTGKFDGGAFTGSMTIPNGYCNPYRITMKRS